MRRTFAAVFSAAIILGACTPEEKEPTRSITIGAVIDLTGNNAEPVWRDSLRLAEKQANEALATADYKNLTFNLVVNDSMNNPTVVVDRATTLVKTNGAKALIVDTSQNSVAANKLHYDEDETNDLNVPIQCAGCTSGSINNPNANHADPIEQETLRNGKGWLFKGIMSTKLISHVIVRLVTETASGDLNGDGKFKVGIFHSNDVFGSSTAADVESYVKQFRADAIVEKRAHPGNANPDTHSWTDDLDALTDDKDAQGAVDAVPDVIVVATFAQYYVPIIRTYATQGYASKVARLMHVHTARINAILVSLGATAEGQEGVSHVLVDGPSGQEFASSYEAEYGHAPRYRNSIYYDSAMTLMLAAVRASLDLEDPTTVTPQQIRDAMLQLNDPNGERVGAGTAEFARAISLLKEGKAINYDGASGPMDYDANQSVKNRLAHYKVQGGAYVDIAKFDCVADASCPAQ